MKTIFLLTTLLSLSFSLPSSATLYELRTYTPHEDKLDDLQTRFRDHTLKIFESHGMANIGYWLTEKKEGEPQKLVYIISHKNKQAAAASWKAFIADPKWQAVFAASKVNGKLVKAIESQYLTATDFSKLK
ncbi:MAG: NIPSNAP family protein [Rubritalea sp.]|jgi:hypothetical protein|tara:strand:+ start:90 stop:482 length:393 start_codon:yes stop_codon:yes gene_type:complete